MSGEGLEGLRAAMPDAARDVKLNLQSVLETAAPLTDAQRWGVAVTSAVASRHPRLAAALAEEAAGRVGGAVVEDAHAAAAIMAMNNVYYRFRHVVGKEAYTSRPARLRMNRLARPLTAKADFELFALAASAINGCEACVRSHEQAVLAGGLTEDHVHDAVRIAATVHAAAVALDIGAVTGAGAPAEAASSHPATQGA